MPNNGQVSSNYTGVFRLSASPNNPPRKIIKRNRQVVSCIPCRTRKLKCDRDQPCASCVRRYDEAACRFIIGGAGAAGSGRNSPVANAGPGRRRQEAQARLQMLEDLVSGWLNGQLDGQQQDENSSVPETARSTAWTTESPDTTQHGGKNNDAGPQDAPNSSSGGGHLRRDGDEVRFVGPTNYAAVLDAIRDLKGWVDTATLEKPSQPVPQPNSDASSHAEAHITIQEVLERLPPRPECDGLLTSYFQQIFLIPVLIHAGQFQKCYEKFWDDPNGTSMLWISILFTLLSTSLFQQALKADDSGDGSSTSLAPETRDKIATFSTMAHRCLLSGEHLHTKPFCVEATLLFGMHMSLQKRDAEPLCWHMLETAVRLAQRMGYHRDASNLAHGAGTGAGMSPFEAEMRRRTWYTLEFFDVVFSFQRGVPPIIQAADVDTKLPSNLRDEEFSAQSTVLPMARQPVDLTPMLSFIVHTRQVKLLRRVVQHALAVNAPSYTDVRRLDADLRALQADIPPCMRYRPVRESGFADVADVIMRRMASEMLFLKCLCVLHRRYLTFERERTKENDMYEASREACREAALRLLALQAEFDEQSAEGGRLFEKRYMLTNTGYHDFLLAAMCLCLDLIAWSQKGSPLPDHDRKIEALRKSRAIWARSAHRSKDAAHAADVLEQILSRVTVSQDGRAAATRKQLPAGNAPNNSVPRAAAYALASSDSPASSSTLPGGQQAPGAKSYSVEWSYEWLDNLDKRTQGPGQSGALTGVLVGDDVDWNQVDSFLLDRTPVISSGVPPDQANAEGSRDGWPYMNYDNDKEGEIVSSFRTWNRTSMLGGGYG